MSKPKPKLNQLNQSQEDWLRFVVLVLAFIGLGQVLSGAVHLLQRWF